MKEYLLSADWLISFRTLGNPSFFIDLGVLELLVSMVAPAEAGVNRHVTFGNHWMGFANLKLKIWTNV